MFGHTGPSTWQTSRAGSNNLLQPSEGLGQGSWVLVSGLCYVSQLGGLSLVAVRELCGVQSVRFSPLGSSQPVLRVLVSAFTPFPPWLLSALSVVSGYAEQLLYASAWAFSTTMQVLRWQLDTDRR